MNSVKVACIGLGNMGGGIAANIVKHGFETTVFDVREAASAPFVALGAKAAASPAEAARGASILCVTVLNDAQLEAVLTGPEGALPALGEGCIIVVHSTVQPETCRKLAAIALQSGVLMVDAPISGGAGAATDGTLTLMVGGSDEAVAACGEVFAAISSQYFHVGDVGAGQIAKLVNNLMGIVNRIAVGEALALARAADLREDTVLELVRASSGNSWQVEHWHDMQSVALASTTGAEGMAAMARKDLGLAIALAATCGVPVPLTTASHDTTANLFTEVG